MWSGREESNHREAPECPGLLAAGDRGYRGGALVTQLDRLTSFYGCQAARAHSDCYLDALPEELFDAARIDSAGDFLVFRALALPLLRPGLATVAIFSAHAAWNEFQLALLYIKDDALKTIPTGLLAFSTRYVTDYSMHFSALSIVTIPMIVIYMVFNRQMGGSRPGA